MMKSTIAIIIGLVCLANSIWAGDEQLEQEWSQFKQKYNKQYRSTNEEQFRKQIFSDNLELINNHNSLKYQTGLSSFSLGVNQFADLTNSEFRRQMNGLIYTKSFQKNSPQIYNDEMVQDLPEEIDWTKKGVVTPIKNQLQCGSCWAFSAVASMESQHALKNGTLVSLSEQNLIDCSDDEGNMGCSGGYMDQAFLFVIQNHGIDTEKSYPYEATDDQCQEKEKDKVIGAKIKSYTDIKHGSELALQSATAKIGPISVGIDASSNYFQLYKSGVYDHNDCSTDMLDHGVAVVGYGKLNGKKYWKVKNSWGTDWGMDGYILMSRDKHNQCGIASTASFPVV